MDAPLRASYRVIGAGIVLALLLTSTPGSRALLASGLGSWLLTTPLPTGRHCHAGVATAGHVYVAGGDESSGAYQDSVHVAPIGPDGSLGAWQEATTLLLSLCATAAVTAAGRIYVVGGYHASLGLQKVVQAARVHSDGSLSDWEAVGELLTERADHAVAVSGDHVYALGGLTNVETSRKVEWARIHSDGSLGPWQATSDMVTERAHFAAVALNGYLYAIGGDDSSFSALTSVEKALINPVDGSLGPWQLTTELPAPRANGRAIAHDGALYFFGGTPDDVWQVPPGLASVYRSEPAAGGALGPWAEQTSMRVGRQGHVIAATDEYVYAIGGVFGIESVEWTAFGAAPPPPGPGADAVLLWRFDEPDGFVAIDSSGAANHGSILNALRVASQPGLGSALSFTGGPSTTRYVWAPDHDSLSGSPMTFSLWIRPARLDLITQMILNKYQPHAPGNSEVGMWLGFDRLIFATRGTEVLSFGLPAANRWYHIVAIVNGADSRLYVDGQERAVGLLSAAVNGTQPFVVGGCRASCEGHWTSFSGLIDEVIIRRGAHPPGDRTPPVVACQAPDPVWHGSNVEVACSATDETALADPADASFNLLTSVPDGIETATAETDSRQVCDTAGNCVTAGPFGGIRVDRRPPSVDIISPGEGSAFVLGQSVTAGYACRDDGSGVVSCEGSAAAGGQVDTGLAGQRTFSVLAVDGVGHSTSRSVGYAVSYRICLLYDPARAHRAGATVPIRLQLCDIGGVNASGSGVTVHGVALLHVSTDASLAVEDAGRANPDSNFRFDPHLGGTGGYVFNLRTSGLATGTYRLLFRAGDDPALHAAEFQVR